MWKGNGLASYSQMGMLKQELGGKREILNKKRGLCVSELESPYETA